MSRTPELPHLPDLVDSHCHLDFPDLADETEAINIPGKSPCLINLYEKLLKENAELTEKSIFYTHFEKKNVLL